MRGYGYGHCSGLGCGHGRGCSCCGVDCGNRPAGILAGMPDGTLVGTAAGGNLAGTATCRNAGSRTAAHCSWHLDTSDGVEEM